VLYSKLNTNNYLFNTNSFKTKKPQKIITKNVFIIIIIIVAQKQQNSKKKYIGAIQQILLIEYQ
jgi:hypothetical protein